MNIPKTYDTSKNYNNSERLTPGGHKCVIKHATEGPSKSGKQMLTIMFDTDLADSQPGFYRKRYDADTRADKKWQGNMYIVLDGEYAEKNILKFISALDHSNENFTAQPGAALDPRTLANLKVGIIFREEEYEPQTPTQQDLMNGVYPTAVRPAFWCNYDKAPEAPVPKKKTLNKPQTAAFPPFPAGNGAGPDYGFVNVTADGLEDEGLPFN